MRSTIIIKKRGEGYICTVSGKFGGGYQGRRAGLTAEDAAITASQEMLNYSQSNSEGGDLVAPAEVMALVPEHLRSVPASEQ